eukprot:scaffold106157_cov23-Tisochrysis_lutea.AAC.1
MHASGAGGKVGLHRAGKLTSLQSSPCTRRRCQPEVLCKWSPGAATQAAAAAVMDVERVFSHTSERSTTTLQVTYLE